MKKTTAIVLTLVLALVFVAGAFITGRLMGMEAKDIALQKAGVTAEEATFAKAELNYDEKDGMAEYEFEFFVHGKEYDVDVDANTGRVVKFEAEC